MPFLGRGVPTNAQVTASFPLSMGGLGLTSAVRLRVAGHWSSWADWIKTVRDRHPIVADVIMCGIDHHPALCFDAVRTCEHALVEGANGVDPSASHTPDNSMLDVATARETVHDKIGAPPQLPRLFRSHLTTAMTTRRPLAHQLGLRPCLPSASCFKRDSIKVGDTSPGAI